MAKWYCRTSDRHHAPRVPGPDADLWRVALAASSCFVCSVLQSSAYALGITERCAVTSSRPTVWRHRSHSGPGRTPSSIRPDMIFGKDKDLFHGLLSVVFWGFASGSNGRLNTPRALSRAKAILIGRKKSAPQAADEIISHLRRSRDLLTTSRIAEALLEVERIKYLQMAFASKVLTFMEPQVAAVYDEVISLRLEKQTDLELRSLFVSTKIPTSKNAQLSQAKTYAEWCHWCSKTASNLNAKRMTWVDWNATEHSWRAVDVERAFFALGR